MLRVHVYVKQSTVPSCNYSLVSQPPTTPVIITWMYREKEGSWATIGAGPNDGSPFVVVNAIPGNTLLKAVHEKFSQLFTHLIFFLFLQKSLKIAHMVSKCRNGAGLFLPIFIFELKIMTFKDCSAILKFFLLTDRLIKKFQYNCR